jgi:hypothetical protein
MKSFRVAVADLLAYCSTGTVYLDWFMLIDGLPYEKLAGFVVYVPPA